MSVLFSKQCDYAIQAMLYLAQKPQGTVISIKEITKKLTLPYHFVSKILQHLTHKGLVTSLKGPTGGFALSTSAEKISLFEIVEAVDGVQSLSTCVLGFPDCSGTHPCGMHHEWAKLRDATRSLLMKQSIASMVKNTKKPQYKIAK